MKKYVPAFVPALVIVLASTGTALGASGHNTIYSNDISKHQVKSSDLDSDSVTSKKIKNGTIRYADLNQSLRALLGLRASGTTAPGTAGPQGNTGATGPEGPQGQRGPSSGDLLYPPTTDELPVGNYIFQGTAQLHSAAAVNNETCSADITGDTSLVQSGGRVDIPADGDVQVTAVGKVTVNSGTAKIKIKCTTLQPESQFITLTRVGSFDLTQ